MASRGKLQQREIMSEHGQQHSWVTMSLTSNYFYGELPGTLAKLTTLKDLRISDLNGTKVSTFPPLSNMRNLRTLMLTSYNIIGSLPEYLGTMNNLTILDLSFNNLSGVIPNNFVNPRASISMYGLLILVFGFLVPVLDANSLKPPKLNSLTDDLEQIGMKFVDLNILESYNGSLKAPIRKVHNKEITAKSNQIIT
ncbi:probable LRR receptor-like serine/threonine-protein kinase At1g53430 [Camellia sinensis]|uniref:probable LRR receptor-like serine/threonine-protein kinase At1g53430 n=1 Tax=Camellia sinensis TaxID=4442 RepID=UPI0010364237|nr:probable LRR receptor-like serine/threonine-protein kinase At1g53430 [Camellia sinensis]